MKNKFNALGIGAVSLLAQACSTVPNQDSTELVVNSQMTDSVASVTLKKPYEESLTCLAAVQAHTLQVQNQNRAAHQQPQLPQRILTVGYVGEESGKYSITEAGAGAFLPTSQAFQNMTMRSLRQAGYTMVNRNSNDYKLIAEENNLRVGYGGKKPRIVSPTEMISGSITGLEFSVESNGWEIRYDGVGAGNRQQTGMITAVVNYTEVDTSILLWSGEAHASFDGDVIELGATRLRSNDKIFVADAGHKETPALAFIANALVNKAIFNAIAPTVKEDYAKACATFKDGEKFTPKKLNQRLDELQKSKQQDQTSSLSKDYSDAHAGVTNDNKPTDYSQNFTWEQQKLVAGMPG